MACRFVYGRVCLPWSASPHRSAGCQGEAPPRFINERSEVRHDGCSPRRHTFFVRCLSLPPRPTAIVIAVCDLLSRSGSGLNPEAWPRGFFDVSIVVVTPLRRGPSSCRRQVSLHGDSVLDALQTPTFTSFRTMTHTNFRRMLISPWFVGARWTLLRLRRAMPAPTRCCRS